MDPKKPIWAILETPDSFVIDLKEKDGMGLDAQEGTTTLRGTISPELTVKGVGMMFTARLQESPDSDVLINGGRSVDVAKFVNAKGQFNLPIKIKIVMRKATWSILITLNCLKGSSFNETNDYRIRYRPY
ncbi:MAG: hypothetical protein DRI57_18750 [Deltaproteobacteria bacterium]|nr:MAG: hypothetical protein DRI57_18750 [Deltaproteobacteria bacterium]